MSSTGGRFHPRPAREGRPFVTPELIGVKCPGLTGQQPNRGAKTATTAWPTRHRLPVRLFDLGFHLSRGELSVQAILDDARKRTGLDDWGEEDFLEPLGVLVEGIDGVRPSPMGRFTIREAFVRSVMNRLEIRRRFVDEPGILERPLERPIFVVGFHRTGTTFMHRLLHQDPANRTLRFWQLMSPAKDRKATARLTLALNRFINPESRLVHSTAWDAPEECFMLFLNTFAVKAYDVHYELPGFSRWMADADMVGPYRDYRRQLQLLAGPVAGARLVVKSPEHLWCLDALLQVFPGARVVWMHRDPVRAIASCSSMSALYRRLLFGRYDPRTVGPHVADQYLDGAERATAARDRFGADRFVDVLYQDLVADPLGTVRGIYERIDGAFPASAEQAIRRYLEAQPGKRNTHSYLPGDYGIEVRRERERFVPYMERFGVRAEDW